MMWILLALIVGGLALLVVLTVVSDWWLRW